MKEFCSLILVWLLVSGMGFAPQAPAKPAPTPEPAKMSDLKWMLLLQKGRQTNEVPQFLVGEPVYMNLVLANWSERHKFTVQAYWHPANDFEINITRAGEFLVSLGAKKTYTLVPQTPFAQRSIEILADVMKKAGGAHGSQIYDDKKSHPILTKPAVWMNRLAIPRSTGQIGFSFILI